VNPDPNAWKRGLRRLSPGLYVDAKEALHIDAAEFLEANGYANTPENEDMLRKTLPRVLKDGTIEDA
jgi:hypothetical protein